MQLSPAGQSASWTQPQYPGGVIGGPLINRASQVEPPAPRLLAHCSSVRHQLQTRVERSQISAAASAAHEAKLGDAQGTPQKLLPAWSPKMVGKNAGQVGSVKGGNGLSSRGGRHASPPSPQSASPSLLQVPPGSP